MRIVRVGVVLAIALNAVLGGPLGAQTQVAYARVTYVSGSSIYIDAGERDGLVDGAALDVSRGGRIIAELRVRFLSPGRAECVVVASREPLVVGDSVRYIRRAAPATPVDTAPAVEPARTASGRSLPPQPSPLRGRVGLRYLASWERDSGQAQMAQPAFDLRLDGALPRLPAVEIAIDARARRTSTVSIDGLIAPSRSSMLVYQSWLGSSWANGARVRLGRQYSSDLAPLSLFDGILLGLERTRVGAGAFAGTQPDPDGMGYSTREREWGGYVTVRADPRPRDHVSVTLGAISSYDGSQLDREFAFLSGSWYGQFGSLYASQEVDVNRGWKRADGSGTLSPTSTYLSATVRATERVSLRAGYDTRRNVRLYRNYVSPDIAFDDSFRTGVWGGVHASLHAGISASLDARHSTGGAADTSATGVARRNASDVYTASAAMPMIWRFPLGVRVRTSRFRTAAASGWLNTLALSGSPIASLDLQLTAGLRRDVPAPGTANAAIADHLTVHWLELDADVPLGRSWYLLLAASRQRGGWESSDQIYSALTYRF